MKKSDIAMLLLIAVLSIMVSYGAVGAVPALKHASDPVEVKVADEITPELIQPDSTVFNSKGINPTVPVTIGKDE